MIREIVEVSGAKVDINDDGIIKIASPNGEAIKKAYDMIFAIVAEPEVGMVYNGKVVKIVVKTEGKVPSTGELLVLRAKGKVAKKFAKLAAAKK